MGHDSNGGIKLQPANVTLDLSKQGHSRKLLLCKVLEYLTVKEVLSTIIHTSCFQQNNRKTLARRYLHDLQLWALNKKITDDEKQNVWTNCFWFRFYFQKRTMLELIYKKEESSFNLIHLMKHALQHYERSFQHDDLNQLTFLANLEKFKPQLQQGFVHSWLNSPYLYTEKHIRKGIKKWIMKHAIPTFFKVLPLNTIIPSL
ncbi:hypothetical protein C9374_008890 [Naegleria lovaniensis]|uniref:Uncharacterized protein n=1 Tax=Naegleria lovaniensis TaxID=51637 RepID=A0AA88GIP7_NAELO|nr:uncharacterized protein C9374_008890 [Naegleria lovaniensis]KAG2377805.1 hypothetical protein C9374_008890 [Naegleria lovaniensis]